MQVIVLLLPLATPKPTTKTVTPSVECSAVAVEQAPAALPQVSSPSVSTNTYFLRQAQLGSLVAATEAHPTVLPQVPVTQPEYQERKFCSELPSGVLPPEIKGWTV